MSVLFCDTDCELWYTYAEELDIKVIKMPYTIDGKEYLYDLGKETDFKGFFDKMRAGAGAITSALNEQDYLDYFEPYFKAGEDILYIAFSSKMSGTFNQMDKAVRALSEKYPTARFTKFDTLSICMGAGLIVYLGAKFFKANGGDVDKTVEYLNSIVNRCCVRFAVEDLKYLARGSRLSAGKAAIGNLLNLKPILGVGESGEIDVLCKQNGTKKALSYMAAQVAEKYSPYDDAPIVIVDADAKNLADELEAKVVEKFPDAKIWRQPIGPVIGAHCGPGSVGVIFPSTGR